MLSIVSLTTAYPIFENVHLVIGYLGGSVAKTKGVKVTWDTTKTTVTGARLIINAISDFWGATFIADFNGNELFNGNIGSMSESYDVGNLLQNGANTVNLVASRALGGATITVTSTLEIDFSGTPPDVNPDWWTEMIHWIADNPLIVAGVAGAGMAAVGAVIWVRKKRSVKKKR